MMIRSKHLKETQRVKGEGSEQLLTSNVLQETFVLVFFLFNENFKRITKSPIATNVDRLVSCIL